MSVTRDKLNLSALTGLLGRKPPPREVAQPLQTAALAAGGPAGEPLPAGPWSESIIIGEELSPLKVYEFSGIWQVHNGTASGYNMGIFYCLSATAGPPAQSIMLQCGLFDHTGTPGAVIYVNDTGDIVSTFTGDESNETAGAPWVREIGWQVSDEVAVWFPSQPWRPRRVTVCATDGTTSLEISIKEIASEVF